MVALRAHVTLPSGLNMPTVGLGTYRLTGEEAYEATLCSLQCGYRLIDTASIYKNHEMIGRAIRDSGVPRQDIFVTSKVSPYEQGADKAPQVARGFLEQLGLEYIDQLLIHWPGVAKAPHSSPEHANERLGSWIGLQDLKKEGLVKSLGVSNFEIHHLEHLVEHSGVLPDVNQVELHPRFQQKPLREYCNKHGIQVVAYSSLGSGNLLSYDPVVKAAAGEDVPRTLLSWALGQGFVVLPRSSKLERIKATAPQHLLSDAHLRDSVREALDACDDGTKYCWNPEGIVI